jgi:uncharacterized protein YkwD
MNRITNSLLFLIVISMFLPTSAIMYASGQSTTSDNSDSSSSDSDSGSTTTTSDNNDGSSTGGSTDNSDTSSDGSTSDNNAAVSSSNGGSTAINNTGNVQGVDVNVILDLHNQARAEVGVPPLTWSDTLAASAQSWAEHLATINEMVHSSGQPYGENLAGWTHGCGLASLVPPLDYNNGVCPGDTLRTMVMSWINEKQDFVPGTPSYPIAGHYTQVVWKDTKEVGCGMATASADRPNDYLVCQYAPPGNQNSQPPY